MKRVCELDVNQPPLCPLNVTTESTASVPTGTVTEVDKDKMRIDPLWIKRFLPTDEWASIRAEFLSLKAPLIFYMLDRRMGKGSLQKSINKILISAMSGDLQNGLSTHHFLKVCRKSTGMAAEMHDFAEQWIFGSGCPRFYISHKFNRKRMMIEVVIKQENTNARNPGATKKFTVISFKWPILRFTSFFFLYRVHLWFVFMNLKELRMIQRFKLTNWRSSTIFYTTRNTKEPVL